MKHILLLDIGNTSVTIGLASGRRTRRVGSVLSRVRNGTEIRRNIARAAGHRQIDGAVLSSVVPALTPPWSRAVQFMCGVKPIVVGHGLKMGFRIDYPKPATIGTDRLVNACGAVARYGCPVIVADFGTALTLDVVSGKGAFIGGIIAPGPQLTLDCLADRTALLPRLELSGCRHPVGRSTAEAMTIGSRVGYTGMLRELIAHVRRAVKGRVTLCATGGYAKWAVAGLNVRVDADLTLYGLSRIYALNVVDKEQGDAGHAD